jgi:steroid delta-isomerase-like uncharacterized protein
MGRRWIAPAATTLIAAAVAAPVAGLTRPAAPPGDGWPGLAWPFIFILAVASALTLLKPLRLKRPDACAATPHTPNRRAGAAPPPRSRAPEDGSGAVPRRHASPRAAPAPAGRGPDGASRPTAALAWRLVVEVLNRGDLTVDELFAPDFLDRAPRPGQGPGAEGYKRGIALLRAAFPDLVHTVDELIAAGDRVVLRLTARGTHRGAFVGLPPTGRAVSMQGVVILRVADGRIVERWSLGDDLGLVLQLSPIPPPAAGQAMHWPLAAHPELAIDGLDPVCLN